MSLNWKIWEQNARGNEELARVYDELWKKAHALVLERWTGEKLSYYLQTTD
jgi:Leu/Phe-tRNA-protein transferase